MLSRRLGLLHRHREGKGQLQLFVGFVLQSINN
jgi:hypothetical protein